MIWSKYSIDETAGFDKDYEKGTLVPRKIGRMVYTLEECDELLKERRKEFEL